MAKPILVANWKNHPGSLSEAQTLIKEFSKKRNLYKKVSLFIAPPFPYFEAISARGKSFAQLAVQNLSLANRETVTGEVTPEILKSFGIRLAIIGHSERRALGESSKDVIEKIKIALRSGITPLVCIGEKERDKDGEHFELLRQELKIILGSVSKKELAKIAIAYEPTWAIGKSAKDAIDPVELSQTIIYFRKVLSDLFGRNAAAKVPILYGGSVEPANARELILNSGIRGFLVGHRSLRAKKFEEITRSLISK